MDSILKKVWSYKTFSELTPTAAQRAIKDDRLFSKDLPWAKSMDPTMVDVLFYVDGIPALLTVTERAEQFPLPLKRATRTSDTCYGLQML